MSKKIEYSPFPIRVPSGERVEVTILVSDAAALRLRQSASSTNKNPRLPSLLMGNVMACAGIAGGILDYMGKSGNFKVTLELQESTRYVLDRVFLACPGFPPGMEYELFAGDIARNSGVSKYYDRLGGTTLPQILSLIINKAITKSELHKNHPDLSLSFSIMQSIRMNGEGFDGLENYLVASDVIRWYLECKDGYDSDNVARLTNSISEFKELFDLEDDFVGNYRATKRRAELLHNLDAGKAIG